MNAYCPCIGPDPLTNKQTNKQKNGRTDLRDAHLTTSEEKTARSRPGIYDADSPREHRFAAQPCFPGALSRNIPPPTSADRTLFSEDATFPIGSLPSLPPGIAPVPLPPLGAIGARAAASGLRADSSLEQNGQDDHVG